MKEEWKKIEGWEYEISNQGRVRTDRPLIRRNSIEYTGLRFRKTSVSGNGYSVVTLCGQTGTGTKRTFNVHRLVWEAFVGDAPEGMEIDHINRNRSDNRLENLRLSTRQENKCNLSNRKNTLSGYKGVQEQCGKFVGYINKTGKRHYLGRYETAEAAAQAYNDAAIKLHGEFASLNDIDVP